jgi:hypothetical protein
MRKHLSRSPVFTFRPPRDMDFAGKPIRLSVLKLSQSLLVARITRRRTFETAFRLRSARRLMPSSWNGWTRGLICAHASREKLSKCAPAVMHERDRDLFLNVT